MMRTASFAVICFGLGAAGCISVDTVDAPPSSSGECNATSAQQFVGEPVSDAMRTRLIEETGARIFQWVGPGMAVTMDYRTDRLRVSYDEGNRITWIACG